MTRSWVDNQTSVMGQESFLFSDICSSRHIKLNIPISKKESKAEEDEEELERHFVQLNISDVADDRTSTDSDEGEREASTLTLTNVVDSVDNKSISSDNDDDESTDTKQVDVRLNNKISQHKKDVLLRCPPNSFADSDDELIPKGPTRTVKEAKEKRLGTTAPYQNILVNQPHFNGGTISVYSPFDDIECSNSSASANDLDLIVLDEFCKNLAEPEMQTLSDMVTLMMKENGCRDPVSPAGSSSGCGFMAAQTVVKACDRLSVCRDDADSGLGSPGSMMSTSPVPASSAGMESPGRESTVSFSPAYSPQYATVKTPRYSNIVADPAVVNETGMELPALQRIKKMLNPKMLNIEWIRALQDDFINFRSEIDDTHIILHLYCPDHPWFFEVLHAQLERIEKQPSLLYLLQHRNSQGMDPLTLALFRLHNKPLVARYIVDTLSALGQDLKQIIDSDGKGLIHQLVERGDEYVDVLAELLNSKKPDGSPVLDIDARHFITNETSLNLCARLHSPKSSRLAMVKLLVKHDASLSLPDSKGSTPIHTAVKHSCCPRLMKALLASNLVVSAINLVDHDGNTALHLAASKPQLSMTVLKQLIESNWNPKFKNIYTEETPIDLLPSDSRKEILQAIGYKK